MNTDFKFFLAGHVFKSSTYYKILSNNIYNMSVWGYLSTYRMGLIKEKLPFPV